MKKMSYSPCREFSRNCSLMQCNAWFHLSAESAKRSFALFVVWIIQANEIKIRIEFPACFFFAVNVTIETQDSQEYMYFFPQDFPLFAFFFIVILPYLGGWANDVRKLDARQTGNRGREAMRPRIVTRFPALHFLVDKSPHERSDNKMRLVGFLRDHLLFIFQMPRPW